MGDLLKVSKERNNKNEYTKEQVLSVSREVGTVNQIEYQGRSFAGADISGYKVVHLGQMIYTKSPLKDAPYGIFQNVTVEGIVSPLYAVYNSTDKALASFIGLQLKDDNLATHYLSPLVSKGAKNTINVTDEGALGGIVFHPSIAEQQEIIDFFTALDHLITLHQRMLLLFFIAVYISLDNDLITKSVSWFSSSCMICKYVFCVVVILECPNLLATLAIVTPSNSNKDACV